MLLLFFSSQLTFCVSSHPTPSPSPSPTAAATTSPLKPKDAAVVRDHHFHVDSIIVIALISVSAVFFVLLVLLLLMAFFSKLFRIKNLLRRTRKPTDQVDVIVDQDQDHDHDDGISGCSVKKYSWDDIKRFTKNFSQLIGSGGFSNVYLAHLIDYSISTNGAIKVHDGSDRLNQVFKQELDILLRLSHDNIVKLIGYCDDRDEGVLLFEYLTNGTLQGKLHETANSSKLPWRNRMAIAFQLAQAIEYLHERCTLHIVHGDIKASNILLDEHLNCKLCDFGSAKMGFSSAVLPPSPSPSPSRSRISKQVIMIGSPGYTDPHYLRTGIASTKNDVYSFGVILLELVTGMEAFCPEKGQLLTSLAGSMLNDIADCEATKVAELVDPRLAGDFDLDEARAMLSVAALCLSQSPILRPSATQILRTLKDQISSISFLTTERFK